MRTNIVLNDDLVQEAFRYSTARSKTGLVEEALRVFVQVKDEDRRRSTYVERVAALDRKLAGLAVREAPGSVLRRDRDRP